MKSTKTQPTSKKTKAITDKQPLIAHLRELRSRALFVAVSVVVGSMAAYGVMHQLIALLLRPSHGQKFIYTSPMGGVNFLFSVCLDIGLILSTPVIVYNLLAFLGPLMQSTTRRFLALSSIAATGLAVAGVGFGYFLGLPSALHFLLHQFGSLQVSPLITIEAYTTFVALYLLASALMFQVPLLLLLINRIKPLRPRTLLKYERHMIAASFIIGFIMNPTPNLVDQLFIVLPVLLMYQLGIGLIWFINRPRKPLITQTTHVVSVENAVSVPQTVLERTTAVNRAATPHTAQPLICDVMPISPPASRRSLPKPTPAAPRLFSARPIRAYDMIIPMQPT